MKQRFFRCSRCGQIITIVNDTNLPVTCCMAEMQELVPNTSDGSTEKHVPMVRIDGEKVTITVGSERHPMTDVHLIEWIAISTSCGIQRKELMVGDEPVAVFFLGDGEKLESVYAYCNQHGLWMSEAAHYAK